jgi:hypothetical protein
MVKGLKNKFSDDSKVLFLFGFIFIIYIFSGFGVTVSNDSTTNIEQITNLNILSRSSHFTFHFFGVLFYIIFSNGLGLSSIASVQLMLALFSITGTISLYYIVLNKFEDKEIAFISVIFYAFSSGIYRFSIQAEYLVLVPSFALISLALYVSNKYILSGITLALGLLTSPFILAFTPAYLIFNTRETLITRKNFQFLAGFLSFYLLISYFTFNETLKGEWSYGMVFDYYKESLLKISYLRVAAIWVYGYLRSFIVVIPFIIVGLLKCFFSERRFFYLILFIGFIHLPLAIPDARYGAYQFTMYPLVSILAAWSIHSVFLRNKTGAVFIIVLFMAVNFYIVLTERSFNRDLRDTYIRMQQDPAIAAGSILFLYQAAKPIQTLYAPKLNPVNIMTGYQEYMAESLPGFKKADVSEIISKNENLYLLESGTSMPDDKFKLLFSGFIKGQGVKVKGFGKEKLIPFLSGADFILMKSYPIDLYKIVKRVKIYDNL